MAWPARRQISTCHENRRPIRWLTTPGPEDRLDFAVRAGMPDDRGALLVSRLCIAAKQHKETLMFRFTVAALGTILAVASVARSADVSLGSRAEELKSLKFGMSLTWGFGTFTGKSDMPGIRDLSLFNPSGCDTDQWASVAKEAGMGYLVFVARRSDGFCMWDTQTTDRKVTESPWGKDVLAAVRKSCDKHGLKFALAYEEGDWTWPGAVEGGANWPGAKKGTRSDGLIAGVDHAGGINPEVKKAQLKELLTQYGPIEFVWFDHALGDGGLSHEETASFVKSLQPGCFVGFNHGQPAGDLRVGEVGRPTALHDPSGAGVGAKQPGIAEYRGYLAAEFLVPIQTGRKSPAQWTYTGPQDEDKAMPAEEIWQLYRDAVKLGNLFSLRVAPDRTGRLRAIDVERLRKVGEMIRAAGEPR
jgi:alpha-L-fucosidase